VLVVNSEVPGGQGGASAIEFAPDGAIRTGRRILGLTSGNCAGGATPWGTWLSCEEVDAGYVFECDPLGVKAAVRRDALGVFKHEAACIDPTGRRVYLTEDLGDSGLYRFTPDAYPDLSKGVLEIATDGGAGLVVWKRLPDPAAATTPTRNQVPGTLRFKRGEGIFFDTGIVYVATTSDDRVHAYDTATERTRCSTTARRSPTRRCTRSTTSRATRRRGLQPEGRPHVLSRRSGPASPRRRPGRPAPAGAWSSRSAGRSAR